MRKSCRFFDTDRRIPDGWPMVVVITAILGLLLAQDVLEILNRPRG